MLYNTGKSHIAEVLMYNLVEQSKNKIAQGDVSIFSQLTPFRIFIFLFFFLFFFFYGKNLSNRQNIIKFEIYGSELVEIDIFLAQFQNF